MNSQEIALLLHDSAIVISLLELLESIALLHLVEVCFGQISINLLDVDSYLSIDMKGGDMLLLVLSSVAMGLSGAMRRTSSNFCKLLALWFEPTSPANMLHKRQRN